MDGTFHMLRSGHLDIFGSLTPFLVVPTGTTNTSQWFESLRSMTPTQRAVAYVDKAALKNADGMMIYLQGGPGFGSPTPVVGLSFGKNSSWGATALDKYKRVVLMDLFCVAIARLLFFMMALKQLLKGNDGICCKNNSKQTMAISYK